MDQDSAPNRYSPERLQPEPGPAKDARDIAGYLYTHGRAHPDVRIDVGGVWFPIVDFRIEGRLVILELGARRGEEV